MADIVEKLAIGTIDAGELANSDGIFHVGESIELADIFILKS